MVENMLVPKKTSGGINLIPIEAMLFDDRKIILSEDIDDDTAFDIAEEILYLNMVDKEKPITLILNSPGGEIDAGFIIYDAITGSSAPIRTVVVGKAHSMAALLLACSKERCLLKHSSVLIHEPLIRNRLGGNTSSIKELSETLLATKIKINTLLALHTGKTLTEIDEATRCDNLMSPQEAIEFGIADKIINFNEI